MQSSTGRRVVGVDGCRGGWLALWLAAAGGRAMGARVAGCWSDLPLTGAAVVAVDMPIGLAEAGPRAADRAARALLPAGRKSSVFAPPRRYMLACRDWAEANAAGRRREGVGLARQSWAIAKKIAELDAALAPADQDHVHEVHPEVVFHALNGWAPLPRKKGAAGRRARLALLEAAGLCGLPALLEARDRRAVAADDAIDAAACALAARRILRGQARRVPAGPPPRDGRGLRMVIRY